MTAATRPGRFTARWAGAGCRKAGRGAHFRFDDYFVYALARGLNDGHYAYPFMDLAHLGWARTIGNALLMAVSFLVGGFILVGLDRLFASRNAMLK